ncbi:membrane-spanning 4-domains subfamily A member 4A-like [Heterodontus francisci]|uniref:membrane-spanning 4-domains subfamily A member 4A-like n=1 Tax=Heterodontus francisci TaxID=7792 RepID=UPI00355C2F76
MATSLSTEGTAMIHHLNPQSGVRNDPVRHGGSQIQSPEKGGIQMGIPKSKGVAQIVSGVLFILFWTPLILSPYSITRQYRIHWWSGLSFIISGSLWCVLGTVSSTRLVRACLVMNLISVLLVLANGFLLFLDFPDWTSIVPCNSISAEDSCHIAATIFSFFVELTLCVLMPIELSISIDVSILGCKTLCINSKMHANKPPNESTIQSNTSQTQIPQDQTDCSMMPLPPV